MSCCRSFLPLGRRERPVVFWKGGVCFTSRQGQEASLEVFLVSADGTSTGEGLFQVREHLEEGHPRLHPGWRSASTQMGTQDALTPAEMPIEPITGVQGQRDGGAFPSALDRSGLLERPDKSPQLLRTEATPGQDVAQADTRRSSATLPPGALLAADAPGADAASLRRMDPPNIAMANQGPCRPAARTAQKRQTCEELFDLRPRPKEYAHPRKVRATPSAARPKTTGLISMDRDTYPGRHYGTVRLPNSRRSLCTFTSAPRTTALRANRGK